MYGSYDKWTKSVNSYQIILDTQIRDNRRKKTMDLMKDIYKDYNKLEDTGEDSKKTGNKNAGNQLDGVLRDCMTYW